MTEPDRDAGTSPDGPDPRRAAEDEETQAFPRSPFAPRPGFETGRDTGPAPGEAGRAMQLADHSHDREPPLVRAADLDYGSGDRRLFAQLNFAVPAGSFGLITGPAGSGKSTLLLALAGRMAGLTGQLTVGEQDALHRPRRVRDITSVARIGGLIDLEPRHRVVDAISDRAGADGIRRSRARRAFDTTCAQLEVEVGPKQLIGDLDMLRRGVLAAVLATLRPSRLLLFDDLQHGLRVDDQDLLATALQRLTDNGLTVIASSTEPTIVGEHIVRIPLPTPHGR